jgi:hypothetical protein
MSLERLRPYSPQQQKDINLVRIYLQATTLSDLTETTDITRIATWAFQGTRGHEFHNQSYWPRQQEPLPAQKRLWKRYLTSHHIRYDRYWRRPPMDRKVEAQPAQDDETNSTSVQGGIPSLIQQLPRSQRRLFSHVQ